MKKFKEKYFDTENKIITTEELLTFEEEIIETYKPHRHAYIMARVLKHIWFIAPWLFIDIIGITSLVRTAISHEEWVLIAIAIIFFGLHLIPVWIWLTKIIIAIKKVNHIEYILTNKRIIVKEGNRILDTHSVLYTTIISVKTDQQRADSKYNVGDIILVTTHKSIVLHNLQNYNEVATIIHKKSVVEYENQRLNDAQY